MLLLDLILTNKEELVRDVMSRAAFAAATVRWWGSGSKVTKGGYRVAVQSCRGRVRKAKAYLDLNLARVV